MPNAGVVRGTSGLTALVGSGPQQFARLNNTTAYTAGDVVSGSASASDTLMKFPLALNPGGGGYIVKAMLDTNLKTFLSQMRLYLFTVPAGPQNIGVQVQADNAAQQILQLNTQFQIGFIDFPLLVSGASASSTSATAMFTGSTQFRCFQGTAQLPADDTIYGYLVDNTGSTPAANQLFTVALEADVY